MQEPLVSAVVITHNRLSLLQKAINSVLAQTYENIEIIVVDDASTDGTYEYFRDQAEEKLAYIRIEPENSKGGNYARNRGIEATKGTDSYDSDGWSKEIIKCRRQEESNVLSGKEPSYKT